MGVTAIQYSVTTTPVKVYLGDGATTVHLHAAGGTVYLGDSDVTSANGLKIDNGDKIVFDTHESALWAVAAGASTTCYTLILTK